MGPLTTASRVEQMSRFVLNAKKHGAEFLAGGSRLDRVGYFWPPTVLIKVDGSCALMKEEPFGPLLPITPYNTIDEAISLANSTSYGLAGYVFSKSEKIISKCIGEVEVAYMGVNYLSGVAEDVPVTGIRDSGYGLEGGLEGIGEFQYHKVVSSLKM
jgi:succinate-semialdehyde dehydrogenase/glutarate-semialdehyde dehydrogenase